MALDPQNPATPENTPNPQNPPAGDPPSTPVADDGVELRKQLAKVQADNDALNRQLSDAKTQGLKSKEDWKAVAELNEKRANDLEADNRRIKDGLINDAKVKALTAEAVKLGINAASIPDLELLDFPGVIAQTDANGRVTVSGAAAAAANLKQIRPHWFTGEAPQINPSTPQGSSNVPNGNVTLDMVLAAQKKYETSKSDSDKQAYEKLLRDYKAQK